MYSFVCPKCGRAFEELLPVSRRDEATCPQCGASASRDLNQEGFCCKNGGGSEGGCCSGHCEGCSGCGGR